MASILIPGASLLKSKPMGDSDTIYVNNYITFQIVEIVE